MILRKVRAVTEVNRLNSQFKKQVSKNNAKNIGKTLWKKWINILVEIILKTQW
jgi:Mg2+/Co2+ transporter CorC